MINVAIVDDDQASIRRLANHLALYGEENSIGFKVSSFLNPVQFLNDYGAEYDLIFMDIRMDMMDGISVCRRLREMDESVCIVFITGFTQYALSGYEVQAFDYIVKPIDYANFCLKMARIIKFIVRNREVNRITLRLKSGCVQIAEGDIIFIEVRGHNLEYHLADKTVSVRGSLKKAEEELTPALFARCSEYFIVNLEKVSGINKNEISICGTSLRIGRAYKAKFMKKFEDCIIGRR